MTKGGRTDMTLDVPLDANTFIVELLSNEAPPDMPNGSLCIFRRYDGPFTDGEIVLTYAGDPTPSASVAYSIRRYREELDDNEGFAFHRSWLESLKVQGRIEDCNRRELIVGRFICVLN
jgi:hypothetical protein